MASSPNIQATAAVLGDANERARREDDIVHQMKGLSSSKFRAMSLFMDVLDAIDVEVVPAMIGNEVVTPHPDYETVLALKAAGSHAIQRLADKHGVFDIAQDNGIRILEIMLLMNLLVVEGRNGNDLVDCDGLEIELKTVNFQLTKEFSSHRDLNLDRIDNYSKVPWLFGFYRGQTLTAIYVVDPIVLSEKFDEWRKACSETGKGLNNRKIPAEMVVKYGALVWGTAPRMDVWKKVSKKDRSAHRDISERADVTSISSALRISRLRYGSEDTVALRRSEAKPVQFDLPLELPDTN